MSITERMTEKLLSDEIISQEEAELVNYGLESLKSDLIGIVMSILIGVCFSRLLEGVLLWGFMYPLRKNAGGFHASTRMRCMLLSAGMLIAAFICLIRHIWSRIVYMLITAIFFAVILHLAPVENPNKRLDEEERRVYGRRARIILIVESVLFLLALLFGWEKLMTVITAGFATVGISLIAGQLKMRKSIEQEE